MIQQHLEKSLRDPDLIKDKSGQKCSGLKKINIHLEKALVGDYPLLRAGESLVIFKVDSSSDAVIQFCIHLFVWLTSKT
jgi:hypothetical protein